MLKKAQNMISRRQSFALGAAGAALLKDAITAEAFAGGAAEFAKDSFAEGAQPYAGLHNGKGTVTVKFFRFSGDPAPANFLIYDIPTQASEGVHTHYFDDHNKQGPFDEYYYIISGEGQMEIEGNIVPVKTGDYVHTPLTVAHGIENTGSENLKVLLTFIRRA